jgi:hypothetical protein
MWRTGDGYAVGLPRFRVRRLKRRMAQRPRNSRALRVIARVLGVLLTRARRSDEAQSVGGSRTFPTFRSHIGTQPVVVYTRVVAPKRVEVLYIKKERKR